MPALCSLCVQCPLAVPLNTVLPTANSPQPPSACLLGTIRTTLWAQKHMNSTLSSVLNHTDTGERNSHWHFSLQHLLVNFLKHLHGFPVGSLVSSSTAWPEQHPHITRSDTRTYRLIHSCSPSTILWTLDSIVHFTHCIWNKKWHLMIVCFYPQHLGWNVSFLTSTVLPHSHIRVHMWAVCAWGAGWCRWGEGVSGNRTTENSAEEHAFLLLQWLGGLAVEQLGVSVWGKHNECENKHYQLFRWLLYEWHELRSYHGHNSRVDEWNFIRQVIICNYWHL